MHTLKCPSALGFSNPMDLNDIFFLAKGPDVEPSKYPSIRLPTPALWYWSTHLKLMILPRQVSTRLYKQNSSQSSNPRQVRSLEYTLRARLLHPPAREKESSCQRTSTWANLSGPNFWFESSHPVKQQASLPSCTLHGKQAQAQALRTHRPVGHDKCHQSLYLITSYFRGTL